VWGEYKNKVFHGKWILSLFCRTNVLRKIERMWLFFSRLVSTASLYLLLKNMSLHTDGSVATIAVLMLTKEDLQAIGALIKAEGEEIRKDMVTKSDLEAITVYLVQYSRLN